MENNLSSLAQKIQQRSKEQQVQLEELITNELTNLQTSLKEKSLTVLNTIEKDMQAHSESISNSLHQAQKSSKKALALVAMKTWGISFLIIVGILLGAVSTGYLGTLWAESKIKSSLNQLSALQKEIERSEKTLQNLHNQTWGIQLQEDSNGNFIVLPKGKTVIDGWKVGDKQALKLENQSETKK